jgi:hypothetical protein
VKAERVAASLVSTGSTGCALVALQAADTGNHAWLWLWIIPGVMVNCGIRLAIDCAKSDRWWSE